MRTFLLAVALAVSTPLAAEPIDVRIFPINAFRPGSTETHFGALDYLGGFQIASPNENFGSLSGIDFLPDGTLVAVEDTGFWFTAKLEETDGKPTGLSSAILTPMLGTNGKPPAAKVEADAEGLRLTVRDGAPLALVSFEQTASVRDYAGTHFTAVTPKRERLPSFVRDIRRNQGLEAIALAPADGPLKGAVVLAAEHSLDKNGNHRAFVLSGPRRGTFSIRRSDDYDISDAAFLPSGDLLILERRFSFSGGFAMRIRRIAGDAIRPGARVDGASLIEATGSEQIDNFEGLAVHPVAGQRTILTLVSDDNGNFLQRTLLLQFALTTP